MSKLNNFCLLTDIVRNHPGLDFLQPLPIFQERYKDTVLARLMYLKPDFWDGRMTLRQFKATNFVRMVAELEENAEMTAQGQQVVGGVGDVNTVSCSRVRDGIVKPKY